MFESCQGPEVVGLDATVRGIRFARIPQSFEGGLLMSFDCSVPNISR